MNVYVWTNILKNAYIGEVYEYSYDFRGKTISQIKADGWTFFYNAGDEAVNSYWLSVTSNFGDSVMAKIENLSWKLTNAKKITIALSWTNPTYYAIRYSLYRIATSSQRTDITWPRIAYNNLQTHIYWVSTTTSSLSLTSYHTATTVIDLEAKTWITTLDTWTTQNWTLTDTQVSGIRNNTIWFYLSTGTQRWDTQKWWLATVYLLVVY